MGECSAATVMEERSAKTCARFARAAFSCLGISGSVDKSPIYDMYPLVVSKGKRREHMTFVGLSPLKEE